MKIGRSEFADVTGEQGSTETSNDAPLAFNAAVYAERGALAVQVNRLESRIQEDSDVYRCSTCLYAEIGVTGYV